MDLHPTLQIIDSSKLNDYIQCPRYFFYRHVLGWRSEGLQFDLIFGEAIHAALESIYRHGFTKDARMLGYANFLDIYRVYYPEETDDDMGPKNPYSAFECLEAYCNYYRNEFDRYEVLEINGEKCIEVSGFAPISANHRLYFRQDCLLREKSSGKIFTLEHKTSSRSGRIWEAQWDLSIQVGTYTHALYSIFPPEEVWGVRVNGIIFLKNHQDFVRVPCEKNFDQMLVWHETVKNYLTQMDLDIDLYSSDYELSRDVMSSFLLNHHSCTKWNRVCAYHDFCTSWANPLQRYDEVPLGFVQDFWDPRTRRERLSEGAKPKEPEDFGFMDVS